MGKELAESNYTWALILEDDITAIADDFDENLRAVLTRLPETWEFCYLGFHTGSLLPKGRQCGDSLTPLSKLGASPGAWLAGLWGYLVSKEGAKELLRYCWPMTWQIDKQVGGLSLSGN